ncbi:hypothetical protein [Vibrio sp. CB1-14]|uniref:Helix-turn-helix type 11 domain-containing protein n=1 Tax=Vibrio chaetopteri TaxID=3016528 RepID=A0AAU8BN41_9VIBR
MDIKDLVYVLEGSNRLWTPESLSQKLGITPCDLAKLIQKARSEGVLIHCDRSEATGFKTKLWMAP